MRAFRLGLLVGGVAFLLAACSPLPPTPIPTAPIVIFPVASPTPTMPARTSAPTVVHTPPAFITEPTLPPLVPTAAPPTATSIPLSPTPPAPTAPPIPLHSLPMYPSYPGTRLVPTTTDAPNVYSISSPQPADVVAAWMFDAWQRAGLRYACSTVSTGSGITILFWLDKSGNGYSYFVSATPPTGVTQIAVGNDNLAALRAYCGTH